MGTQEYYNELADMSLSRLLSELESEKAMLRKILSEDYYDGRNSHLDATRDNIAVIERLIDEKSG